MSTGNSNDTSPIKPGEQLGTVYRCPMKSCETKVTLASVEKHLTISHPDVFVLFKRILMQKYGLSVKGKGSSLSIFYSLMMIMSLYIYTHRDNDAATLWLHPRQCKVMLMLVLEEFERE
jgi:hypothetical protein